MIKQLLWEITERHVVIYSCKVHYFNWTISPIYNVILILTAVSPTSLKQTLFIVN